MSDHPDARDQEIARQVAKLEPGDSKFVCVKCVQIWEEEEQCIKCSEEIGAPVCHQCCVIPLRRGGGMICEELEKEITSETCAAMKKHSWCDQSCEQKPLPKNGNGGNGKSPENNPIAIAQDSPISENTPKEVKVRTNQLKRLWGILERKKEKSWGHADGETTNCLPGRPAISEEGKRLGFAGSATNRPLFFLNLQKAGAGQIAQLGQ